MIREAPFESGFGEPRTEGIVVTPRRLLCPLENLRLREPRGAAVPPSGGSSAHAYLGDAERERLDSFRVDVQVLSPARIIDKRPAQHERGVCR